MQAVGLVGIFGGENSPERFDPEIDWTNFQLAIFFAKQRLGGLGKVALKMGVSRQAVRNWEKARSVPSDENVKKIAEILKVDERVIFGTMPREEEKEASHA